MDHPWKILSSRPVHACANMALDAALLNNLAQETQPLLHFYQWQGDCATYGHFIHPDDFLNLERVTARKVQLAKRPTGGGILFHLSDLAFSVLVPACHSGYSVNTLDNYAFVNQRIINAIITFLNGKVQPMLLPMEKAALDESSAHFCMAKPTKYDVMIEGKKVSGGAQRRTKHGFLHQGTIALALPSEDFLRDVLKPETCVFESMQNNSYPLLPSPCPANQLEEARQELRQHLIHAFT